MQDLGRATQQAWSGGNPSDALANAVPYLQAFGHTVLDAAAGEATRREALRLFKSNFAPGELAALALSHVATTIEGDHVS